MPPLVDAHTHLDHYEPAEIPGILRRAADVNVRLMVCAGTTLVSTRNSVALANEYSPIYAGVGFHPADLQGPITDAIYDEFKSLAQNNPKVVCVSEIGLDFLPTSPEKEVQLQAFRAQIRLAIELKKPIVFHSRESHPEVLQTLREEGADAVGGVMHYFQGDEATAREAIDLGFRISLAKPLLRLPELQEVARVLPLDHIVLETDSAPQPFKKYRHNWTEPRHLVDISEKLAELKRIPVDEVVQTTTDNLLNILGLDPTVLEPDESP